MSAPRWRSRPRRWYPTDRPGPRNAAPRSGRSLSITQRRLMHGADVASESLNPVLAGGGAKRWSARSPRQPLACFVFRFRPHRLGCAMERHPAQALVRRRLTRDAFDGALMPPLSPHPIHHHPAFLPHPRRAGLRRPSAIRSDASPLLRASMGDGRTHVSLIAGLWNRPSCPRARPLRTALSRCSSGPPPPPAWRTLRSVVRPASQSTRARIQPTVSPCAILVPWRMRFSNRPSRKDQWILPTALSYNTRLMFH